MDFPPTARIDTRLTILDWPLDADEELAAAVAGVATFEFANDAPALVEDATTRHLAWRGYLTGGLLTLYEHLGAMLSDRGLSAFYADPRLEVFVPSDGEVVVLGALRHPIRMERGDWDARVVAADGGNDLAERFIHDAMAGADDVIAQAGGQPNFELTERFDPEGNPDESWVSCRVLRWRTDFVPPGTVREPDQRLEDALGWRVSQWQWVPDETEGEDDEDAEAWGDRALRGHTPITAATAAESLPEPLKLWVRRMTEQAMELFENLETPESAVAARRLSGELKALG